MSEQNSVPMTITSDDIRNRIYTIRGMQVMLDSDLAAIYGYETKNFNRQVRNNIEKFPEDMMFRLTKEELDFILRCKKSTSSWGGARYLPYAFTEQGIYMLMTVLKGELATKQSLALIRAFKSMRDYLADNAIVFQRLDRIELKQLETDENIKQIRSSRFSQGQVSFGWGIRKATYNREAKAMDSTTFTSLTKRTNSPHPPCVPNPQPHHTHHHYEPLTTFNRRPESRQL